MTNKELQTILKKLLYIIVIVILFPLFLVVACATAPEKKGR